MGKKSKFKQIRRMAEQIPAIPSSARVKVQKTGMELLKEGIKEADGKPINPLGRYYQSKKVAVPTNHNRKMKKLYNKSGHAGVKAYLNDTTEYLKKLVKPENESN